CGAGGGGCRRQRVSGGVPPGCGRKPPLFGWPRAGRSRRCRRPPPRGSRRSPSAAHRLPPSARASLADRDSPLFTPPRPSYKNRTYMIFEMLRGFLKVLFALLPIATTAAAADYPTKPLHLIVPFAPGGGNDVLARLVSTQLASGLGQQVIVDNRPGASGITATDIVAKSAPDGYTVLLGFIGPLALSPALTKVPYDSLADFVPLDFL